MTPALNYEEAQKTLKCAGAWTILHLTAVIGDAIADYQHTDIQVIDAENLTAFDSAGAEMILKIVHAHPKARLLVNAEQKNLLKLIQSYPPLQLALHKDSSHPVADIGKNAYAGYLELLLYFSFVGQSAAIIFQWLLKPQKILWRSILKVIENAGYYGMPIIGLLSFLVGVVLAYQIGVQLENYGANIYVVNLLGISILREFAPLIMAIIVAGRTGSAFTAELGTMKVNQELDALLTMGVKPIEYLVVPKIIGLMLVLPLLSMWAFFTGILGGMIMSKTMLGITFSAFLHQFQQAVEMKQLWIGLIKTPVFAYVIASIGCFQGMQVAGGAESVGQQTTRSVVQALFLIIVIDAFFSILLSMFHA